MAPLRTLRDAAGNGVRHELVCPDCGAPVVLTDGLYWCDGALSPSGQHEPSCGFYSATLGALVRLGALDRSGAATDDDETRFPDVELTVHHGRAVMFRFSRPVRSFGFGVARARAIASRIVQLADEIDAQPREDG